MSQYLLLWELDETKIPISPDERGAAWSPFVDMVRQSMKQGSTKFWGSVAGEPKGFAIFEGDEMALSMHIQQFMPFVKFKVHPIISIDQMDEIAKNLQK